VQVPHQGGESRVEDGVVDVDELVTVVLALSNGLAVEQYVAPELVSDSLFGSVLERLSH
jgi:hypothetical protein